MSIVDCWIYLHLMERYRLHRGYCRSPTTRWKEAQGRKEELNSCLQELGRG